MESKDQPTGLVLTRQNLPTLEGTKEKAYEGVKKGAYVISDSEKETPDALLLATGSEVQLAVASQKALKASEIDVRVVSMPSWDRFNVQDEAYKNKVIPPHVKSRLAIEMASPFGWERYVGDNGKILGIDTFGASANGDRVVEKYGFTIDNVIQYVESLIK